MLNIKIDLRDAQGQVVERIEGSFSLEALNVLRNFSLLMSRVRRTRLLTAGLPSITKVALGENGLEMVCGEYSDDDLFALLHVLRPVTLEEEPTSFVKTASLLKRGFKSRELSGRLRALRKMFEHGEFSFYMQFVVVGQNLFEASTLRNWLNGTQYHTDIEKAEVWKKIEEALGTQNARALVISQVHSRVKALFMLEGFVDLVLAQVEASRAAQSS